MALQASMLVMFFAETVVEKRVDDRDLKTIDPAAERAACFDAQGQDLIEETARHFYENRWRKMLKERWEPKSRKALEREAQPPRSTKLAIKPVRDKHFISRWLIRDYWAQGDMTMRWRLDPDGWDRDEIRFGSWGHRQGSWGDRLEAYFGLLEGDAKRPIQMLLRVEPLNPPQMESFVGYLVIHILRNPQFIRNLRERTREVVENGAREQGTSYEDMAIAAFEVLFKSNDLYRAYANPISTSQWAIISSETPIFVLPDTFCARGAVNGGPRVIVPLTPFKCFVTLPQTEEEKAIVPRQYQADRALKERIARVLIAAADREFLAHPDFDFPEGPAASFDQVLAELGALLSDA